jgi:putative DNA primase/helicase
VNREEVESALGAISPDLEYEDWIHVGMALCHVYGPAAGFDWWDRWSSSSSKYPGRESLATHWKSWSAGVSTVTELKIFSLANSAGWRWKRKRTPLRSIEGGKKTTDTPPKRSAKTDTETVKKRPKEFWEQVNGLGERFTLIYGTDTAYDHVKRKIIKVANMRIAFGKDPVNFWLAGRDRRMVDQDNVVFDPTGKAKLPDHVNLFYGMQLAPDASKPCQKIIELLNYLCNEELAVFEWVLKWIAYPLQHPGAKMESAIVMHGEEGLGKSFFWKVVSRIYQDYATLITQNELESQFNTWSSRKLLMVANEVVSRSELREHKGRLKNYITETELQINEKLLPLRTERNHMNFVFLSNETQPLALDRTDRRYLVIWTPAVAQPKEFYQAVGDEFDGGGAAGLYAYLLALDLEDFNEHTKPILTEAKRNLIEISKPPPELFYDQWAAGLLPVRFISALAADLYRSFTKWCSLNGEKHPPSETKFGSAMRRLGLKRDRDWLMAGHVATKKSYLTYYTVPIPKESPLFGLTLDRLVSEFSQDLESWVRGEGYHP